MDADLVYVPSELVDSEQLLQPGDIVICMSSGSKDLVGKAAQLKREWNGSFGAFCAAASFKQELNQEYLGYFLQSPMYRQMIREKASGVNINNLRRGDIEEIPVPVPPRAEQNRIADVLDQQLTRLNVVVASLHRLQQNLSRYRASVLKAAFEGRLVPQDPADEPAEQLLERILEERRRRWEAEEWQNQIERAKKKVAQARKKAAGLPYYIRDLEPEDWEDVPEEEYRAYLPKGDRWKGKYEEPEPLQDEHMSDLPNGWQWTNLDALLREPLRNGRSAKATDSVDGVRTLTLTAVTEGDFSKQNTKLTEADPGAVEDLWLEPGDILIERSNTPELVGTTKLYEGPCDFAIFPDLMIRARVSELVSTRFIEAVLRSERTREYYRRHAKGISGSMPKIDQETVRQTPVPLAPNGEQLRIVAEIDRRLSIALVLEESVHQSMSRAERLRQAILEKAFTGQLVPQDRNDEPAEKLLERIRAERGDRRVRQPSLFEGEG